MLGISDTVTSLAGTTAREKALAKFYDSTVETALKYQPWNFATRYYDFLTQAGAGTVTVTGTNLATFTTDQDGTLQAGDTITIGGVEYVIGARTSGTVWATSGANVAAQTFTIAKERTDDPTDDWAYSYRMPSKMLIPRRVVDGNRTPIRTNRPVFRTGADSLGKLLYCDYDTALVVEYTEVVDESQFPTDFAEGVAGLLAYKVANLLTQGDPNQMGMRAYQWGMGMLAQAAASDGNENVPDDDPLPDTLQFRGGLDVRGGWPTRDS